MAYDVIPFSDLCLRFTFHSKTCGVNLFWGMKKNSEICPTVGIRQE